MSRPTRSSTMTRLYRSASSRAVTPSASAWTWIGVPCSSVPLTISTWLPRIRWYRENMSQGRPKPDTWPMCRGPFAYGHAGALRMWRLVMGSSLVGYSVWPPERLPCSAPGHVHVRHPAGQQPCLAADLGVQRQRGSVPEQRVQIRRRAGERAVRRRAVLVVATPGRDDFGGAIIEPDMPVLACVGRADQQHPAAGAASHRIGCAA